MSSLRTATKSNTSTTQSVSRPGRNARKRADEKPGEDARQDCADTIEESEDVEAEPSQGTAVQDMIIGNLNARQRHTVNKKKVKENYSSTAADLQNNITVFFDAHEKEADAVHRAQMERLTDLLARKSTIEAQMIAKLTSLRALYDAHSKELTSVVGSRIKELK
ncbi:hypothetical protein C7974DRAFT_84049 [Boeremia exigua]|uniref:uncharacterized protein n=1 Tax=Boeremia exigua TaxID=749465 RepID=UPI001E8DAF07|nr:uncharacterized protein C7974DRAFT_84049 [Boeremia exigua]KAH6612705.1 hypothetical protein C7974DRAFT_84049 [Boeremia exigua]